MAVADQTLAIDEAIADPPTIVWAFVRHHHHPTALEPGHSDRSGPITGPDHPAERDVDRDIELGQLRDPVIRVVPELVVELCADGAHVPTVLGGSDKASSTQSCPFGQGRLPSVDPVAAVLVHIDLDDAERPDASSLIALAAGRHVASSWGATLYAAVIVHDPAHPSVDATTD